MGGHDAIFDPPLDDKYKCPVCLTALRDPIQTKCGHRLCQTCFKTIRGGNWYFRCPVDNTWSNHVFDDNAVKREVLSLTVLCNNDTCNWRGELRELQTHLKGCGYEKIICPNKCKLEIMRIDIDKHLHECPLRMETCSHCNIQVIASQLARHHVLLCPKFPVNCPVCGGAEIVRESMNSHINIINGDCPMVIVPCSFRHIGCMHQDKRCKMPKHYIDSNTHHLMLLSTRLIELETKHRIDLQVYAKKFEQNLTQLMDKFNESECKYTQLETECNDNKRIICQLKNSLKELKIQMHSSELSSNKRAHHSRASDVASSMATVSSPPPQINKWKIDLTPKRKAYFSPSYALNNTSYKIHLWFKSEIVIDSDLYSTISVILERCDNEDELPVCFDCCFYLNGDNCDSTDCESTLSTKHSNNKTYVTTDTFYMSGHVSKPMILYKTNDLFKYVKDNKINLEFTICAIKEAK